MAEEAKDAFKKVGSGSENSAYDIIAKLDPDISKSSKGSTSTAPSAAKARCREKPRN